jgi:ADP-heptose:LPS heptosyltransferase
MLRSPKKLLIIRLSSFGDIAQCLSVVTWLKSRDPKIEIDWVVREDFSDFVSSIEGINKIYKVGRKQGLARLYDLAVVLKDQKYDWVYDAHNNVRSHLLSLVLVYLNPDFLFKRLIFVRRSKNRFRRWLLFRFRKNTFPMPFRAQISFLQPIFDRIGGVLTSPPVRLKKSNPSPTLALLPDNFILLAPSAAWDLKKWPEENWHNVIQSLPQTNFVVVGGPEDQFCEKFEKSFPGRVQNMAGKFSWSETAYAIEKSSLVISGDTGVLHVADLLHKKAIALIGPTAFGYPTQVTSKILEIDLYCKPCSKDGRGQCINAVYKKCMISISPEEVVKTASLI